MSQDNYKLTSAKLPPDLLEVFKIESVRNRMTTQKLLERSMFLYVTSEEFRTQIHNQINTNITGSK